MASLSGVPRRRRQMRSASKVSRGKTRSSFLSLSAHFHRNKSRPWKIFATNAISDVAALLVTARRRRLIGTGHPKPSCYHHEVNDPTRRVLGFERIELLIIEKWTIANSKSGLKQFLCKLSIGDWFPYLAPGYHQPAFRRPSLGTKSRGDVRPGCMAEFDRGTAENDCLREYPNRIHEDQIWKEDHGSLLFRFA